MYRKTICFMIVLLCLSTITIFSGCSRSQKQEAVNADMQAGQEETGSNELGQGEPSIVNESLIKYYSLDEAVMRSYCVVTAKLNGIYDRETYREYDFSLGQTIIGVMEESSFLISEGYTEYTIDGIITSVDSSYSTLDTEYKVGEEYILVLYKISSVYFGDSYQIAGDVFIQLNDKGNIVKYQRYHEDEQIELGNVDEFADYVSTIVDSSEERPFIGVEYTDSAEIPDIVDASQFIVRVVVSDMYKELPSRNWDIYRCKVTESLRGFLEQEVLVLIFEDTVTIGKEYILLLNRENENSTRYSLSSRNSVIDVAADKAKVDEIVSLIAE